VPRIFHQPLKDARAADAECHFSFCIETTFAETAVEEKSLSMRLLLFSALLFAAFASENSPNLTRCPNRSQPSRDACVAGQARHRLGVYDALYSSFNRLLHAFYPTTFTAFQKQIRLLFGLSVYSSALRFQKSRITVNLFLIWRVINSQT
jgi:hypothetical protein